MTRHQRQITRLAQRYGRRVERARNGHLKPIHDRLPPITCSCSPSCRHALKNVERDLERFSDRKGRHG